jgi:hypothetical protein
MRALQRLGVRLPASTALRFEARLAYITGQTEHATELFRTHVEGCVRNETSDEAERARWALGRVLRNDEGARMCEAAENGLRELGLANPLPDLVAYFPELA